MVPARRITGRVRCKLIRRDKRQCGLRIAQDLRKHVQHDMPCQRGPNRQICGNMHRFLVHCVTLPHQHKLLIPLQRLVQPVQ
eukprot:6030658-Amphidinium_carterae.1